MTVGIVPTGEFVRQAKRLAKKHRTLPDDLEALQRQLTSNPFAGTDLGGGKRKIRMRVGSKGKGKSGGFRVITYNVVESGEEITIYLITIYDKSEYGSISDWYVDQVVKSLQ